MIIDFVGRQGGQKDSFELGFGGSEELGQIAIYAGKPGDPGLNQVKFYTNSLTFHLGAVFADYPKLRPTTKVDCNIRETVDDQGVPCLTVQVVGAPATKVGKRRTTRRKQKPPETAPSNEAN
jgi:hypothetical protein